MRTGRGRVARTVRRAAKSRHLSVELHAIRLDRGGRTVLRDIDWRILPGQRWVLLGANGAGKTQLLKLLSGAVWPTPTRGARRIYRWRGERFDTPHGVLEQIAYVGAERQDKYDRYGWNHTVEAVVGTGVHRTEIPLDTLTARERSAVGRALVRVGIAHLSRRRMLSLSYGERRLVLIARALASRPGLLLLDEPLNGLDAANRERVSRWLDGTHRARLPWVIATHRYEDVPASVTHVLALENGVATPVRKPLREIAKHLRPTGPRAAREPAARSAVRRSRAGAGPLVALRRASVYLDGTKVLHGLTFEIHPGECWVAHGPNGAGKTTLIRTLYGDHGVAVGGQIVRRGIAPGVPLEVFRRRVGLVAPHLQSDQPRELTVEHVVQSGLRASIGLDAPATAAERGAARRALRAHGLAAFARRRVAELSYGQLRRVLFARAVVNRPWLLLLDEPLEGVDATTRHALLRVIDASVKQGLAVVLATHHRAEWPAGVTHELALEAGRVTYCGPRLR
jgi:molybdate transport system ATP-binding protein